MTRRPYVPKTSRPGRAKVLRPCARCGVPSYRDITDLRCDPCDAADRKDREHRLYGRPTAVLPHADYVVFACVECGRITRRDKRASLCWPCRRARHRKRSTMYVRQRRATDPDYDALYRARHARYAREERARRWPVPCVMCGVALECLQGRHRTAPMCRRCAAEHKNAFEKERLLRRRRTAAVAA